MKDHPVNTLGCWTLLFAGFVACDAEALEFDLGLRYDRARSGHGLEIHRAGQAYAVFFYTYGEDESPEWFLCDGRVVNGVMLGDCLRFTVGDPDAPMLVGDDSMDPHFALDFIAASKSAACNDGVDRSDAEQLALFSWRAQDELHQWCTEFLPIGAAYPSPSYYGGIWFGGDDGGYGCSLSHMDQRISAICYYYDDDGEPRWAIGLGDPAAGPIEMLHHRGFCRSCERAALRSQIAGSLSLQLDPAGHPGNGQDRAVLMLDYPDAPGGQFTREFPLLRLTDGQTQGDHRIPAAAQQSVTQVALWNEELDAINQHLRATHPNPFHCASEDRFNADLATLRGRIPRLRDDQIRFEILRLVASTARCGQDGHTNVISINSPVLPVQIYRFSDGWFVVDALPPYRHLIGMQINAMAGQPMSELERLVALGLSKDNDNTVRWILGTALLVADAYTGTDLNPSADAIAVTLLDGAESVTESVRSISLESYSAWKPFGRNTLPARDVLYLQNTDEPFWFTVLDEASGPALYIQYNAVVPRDSMGLPIARFVVNLREALETFAPERVIIDLRHNNGGNNTTYGLLLALLAEPQVNREGKLFAIIGRQTFSAAMNFIADLEAATSALFVGEGSGGSLFHYGDSEGMILPRSGMLFQVSSRTHESPIPGDQRLEISADIPAALSSADFFANRDPILQAALEYQARR